jgi:TolB-like protein
MQIAATVVPALHLSDAITSAVVLFVILGFPIALIFAWAFELTPEGLKRTEFADELPTKAPRNRAWIYVVIIAGAISVGVFFLGRYTSSKQSAELPAKSIAVLPFDNQNRDPDTEYLSDGIPESIINSLSQLPNLKVMSRNSVFHYKGKDTDAQAVAKELKVQAVLTGRLTQRAGGLSISVELINAQDNSEIWGQQYNRKLADVFAVQEEIAKEISEKLRLKLTGAERQQLAKRPTENLKAFQYYMQGRAYAQRRTREDLLQAIHYCEKAIEEDHNYALAYVGLSDAYENLGLRGYIAPQEGRRQADESARKALALDENLAESHAALGQAYVTFTPSNFPLGDRELRRAIELSPSLALAHFYLGNSLARQGRLGESLEEYLKARELDPLSSIIARGVATPYYLKRDYGRALELLRQANELGPAFSATWEIGVYIQNRLFNETLTELGKAKGERKNDSILIYDSGIVYAAQGKRAEALQIIKELEVMSGTNLSEAHWIAKIYATLNEKELAFSWLERGLAAGAIGAFYKDEPVWDTIRSDPRFADLLRRMGIPP